jgi:hypothetical protein
LKGILLADISLRTASSINQHRHIITEARFRELTGNVRIEDLSQEVAAPIEAHLTGLYETYSDYVNIILEFVEEHNERRRLHNPREWADGIVPRLMDRVSRLQWKT